MDYFRCNFASLSESKIENTVVDWSPHRDFVFAFKSARFCKPPFCWADFSSDIFKCTKCPKVDISMARSACERHTPVIKTVRTKDMKKLKYAFSGPKNKLDPRIIINVRDPRAVLNSRKRLEEQAQSCKF